MSIHRRKHPLIKLLLILVVLSIISVPSVYFVLAIRHNTSKAPEKPQEVAKVTPPKPTPQSVSGRYLFNGTVTWARAIEKWSLKSDGNYDYAHPFSGLSTFGREQYDEWVADLECPSLDTVVPYDIQVNKLIFNCRPEFMPKAARYFSIFDLANNHTYDQGPDGLPTTRERIIDNGMQTYGNYDPSVKDDACEVMGLRVRVKMSDGSNEVQYMPVAFCAWHYLSRLPKDGEIEQMTQYSKVMPVFAFVHMGTEYQTQANVYQAQIARRIIDAGADFVIANHPHWVQNTEVYKGKLIVYSTGNFIFDQVDAEGMRSASIDTTFDITYDKDLEPWLAMGESCKKMRDNCFQRIKAQDLKKPKYSFKFAVVAGDNSNHLTKKGDPALQKAIEERMNWTDTLKKLEQNP